MNPKKRKIPDEYEILTLKLNRKIKKEVEDEIAAFLVVGSVAHGNYMPGESDCDFYLVIKKDRDKQVDILRRIGDIKAEFEADPQYSAILDMMVFFEEDITEENINASSIVNWVHIWTGQNGELKIGKENPFNKVEVTEDLLKHGATQMALDFVFLMRDGFLNAPKDNQAELLFYASDAAIGCAQALLIFEGVEKFNRYNIPEVFAENIKIGVDPKFLTDARDFRIGAKIDNEDEFPEKCYDFSWAIVEYMLDNIKV